MKGIVKVLVGTAAAEWKLGCEKSEEEKLGKESTIIKKMAAC